MKIRTGRKRSTGKTGGSYILRNIPRQDWEKAKAKARSEGRTIRWVIIKLVGMWVEEEIKF